jgi:hypothetical protein
MSLVVEQKFLIFLVLTVIMGGGAAVLAGRGLAMKWRPVWAPALAMVPLTLGLRFLHYALFGADLTSLHYLVTDFLILLAGCYLGYRMTLTKKMVRQYPWLYEAVSPVTWRPRSDG